MKSKIIPILSKKWLKVKNIKNSLFPDLEESLGLLSTKEQKLIKILDFLRYKNIHTAKEMLSLVSNECRVEIKQSSKGNKEVWIGGSLHISPVDENMPITAFYSDANVNNSSLTLPLIAKTSKRVNYMHDLQDARYNEDIIREFSIKHGYKPIV